MANKINISKTRFNKEEFENTVDTEFEFFVDVDDTAANATAIDSIDEFFRQYDELFFSIPVEGDIKSHTYLVNRSGELVNEEPNNELIQPLLDEIADLRQQLLESRADLLTLTQQSIT